MARVTWQCSKCGLQTTKNDDNLPPQENCPAGQNHVWVPMVNPK